MSLTRKIAGHTVYYGSAQVLILASGIISMPIFTRTLSEAEYGMLNIIGVTVALLSTALNGGLRHSLYRLYGEYQSAGKLPSFLRTYVILVVVLAIAGLVVAPAVFLALKPLKVMPGWALPAALIACPLVFVRLVYLGLSNIYRMREEVRTYNLLEIATKYIAMGLCIWFVVSFSNRLQGYFLGLLLGEGMVFAALCLLFFRRPRDLGGPFSYPATGDIFRYGLPLAAGSLAGVLFSMSDRYVIQILLGPEQVAQYSIGSQLSTYTCAAIVAGFQFALIPAIMNAWTKGEREAAQATLGNLVRYYALAAFPITIGLVAVRSDLIHLLASERYLPAATVVPVLVGGALLSGLSAPLLIGLHFAKRTGVLAVLAAAMAVTCIGLDLLLIPLPGPFGGIMGAAIANVIANFLYILIGHLLARKHCSIVIPWRDIASYAVAAAVMYLVVTSVSLQNWIVQLCVRILLGGIIYVPVVLLLDRRLRTYASDVLRKLRS